MYLIGIDLGTSGVKSFLFDEDGNVVKDCSAEYPLSQPFPGWAEQDPEDWRRAVVGTLCSLTDNIDASKIAGIGLTGQMHGLVMLDKDNNVIRPAIIWCDNRTAEECQEITALVGAKRLMDITANPALAGFTASKIMWVKKHEPQNWAKCCHILLPKDYIRFVLTGEYASDVSDASGMQLMDIKNRCWSEELLDILDINSSLLPTLYESPDRSGSITREISEITNIPHGTPVAAGAGDNAAAAIGSGVYQNGKAFATIGTSGVVFAHTDEMRVDESGRVHTFCCAVPGAYHVMGVTQAAGLSLRWFRDNFCRDEISVAENIGKDPYYLMDMAAEQSPPGCRGLVFLPYLMAERTPHLDPYCRGAFFGLSAAHTKADMIRSVMEGVMYSLKDCCGVLDEMGVLPEEIYMCGGGARSPLWKRMAADIFGLPIKTLSCQEGPALGAAILAGVCAGVYKSVADGCSRCVKVKETVPPTKNDKKQYEKAYDIYRALYPALKSIYRML